MKFSGTTLAVLKNFASINPSVMFKSGNTIRTISPQKTVMASATIEEKIESNAGVYDLSRFLSTLSLFDDPEVEFLDTKFVIKSGKSRVSYTYAAESMIVTPPDSDIKIPNPEVQVRVAYDILEKVIRAAGVLQLGEIAFKGDGETVRLSAIDSKNPTADAFDVVVAEVDGPKFEMIIKVENLKLMPADYDVSLSSKGLAHFKADTVQYFIAIEKNSKFGV
tara:strand:+ start:3995 stop:4657 length:663 start_codon:yes stop_codon:yes gene_type:complete